MSADAFSCRACGSAAIQPILDLGETPLANALLDTPEPAGTERLYPLDLVYCTDCSLTQITETVPPEVLFDDYPYFSSFSDTMLQHAKELAAQVSASRRLGPEQLVVELASNDGYLLQYYVQAGVPVLGIEPAANIAKHAVEELGIDACGVLHARVRRRARGGGCAGRRDPRAQRPGSRS